MLLHDICFFLFISVFFSVSGSYGEHDLLPVIFETSLKLRVQKKFVDSTNAILTISKTCKCEFDVYCVLKTV